MLLIHTDCIITEFFMVKKYTQIYFIPFAENVHNSFPFWVYVAYEKRRVKPS